MSSTREIDRAERRDGPGTGGLWALRSYWDATPEERARVCNGAGPGWLDRYLPPWLRRLRALADRLWGLDCRRAFDIHDWDYHKLPPVPDAKIEADNRLRDNLESIVRGASSPQWLTNLRLRKADRYLALVREFGFKAFFDRK